MDGVWTVAIVFLWLMVLAQGVVLLAIVRHVGYLQARRKPGGLPGGFRAPSFALPDPQGGTVRLADRGRRPALIAFLSSTCVPCYRLVAPLNALQEETPNLFVVVVTNASANENRTFQDEHGLAVPVLSAVGTRTWSAYEVPGTPHVCAIDREGAVISSGGAHDMASLQRHLGMAGTVVSEGPSGTPAQRESGRVIAAAFKP